MSTLDIPGRPSLDKVLFDHLERIRRLEALKPFAVFEIKLFADEIWGDRVSVVTVGDSRFVFPIDEDLDGWTLYKVQGGLSTVGSGVTTVQVRNVTQAVDMLSTRLTIDSGEFSSCTAAAPVVVNQANAQVDGCDRIALDVDTAGTGARGLAVIITLAYSIPGP